MMTLRKSLTTGLSLGILFFISCTEKPNKSEVVDTESTPVEIKNDEEPTSDLADENEYIIYPSNVLGLKIGDKIDKRSDFIVADILETGEGSFLIYKILTDNTEVVGYIFPDPADENLIGSLEVTNPKFKTEKGIGIGSTIEELKEQYEVVYISGSEIEGRTSAAAGGLSFLLNVNFWTYEIDESKIDPATEIVSISLATYDSSKLKNESIEESESTLAAMLQGKWQSVDDSSSYIIFEGNLHKYQYGIRPISDGEPFVLANACKNELNKDNGISSDQEKFLSLVESNMCYYIIDVAEEYLSMSYVGRGNRLNYRKVNSISP